MKKTGLFGRPTHPLDDLFTFNFQFSPSFNRFLLQHIGHHDFGTQAVLWSSTINATINQSINQYIAALFKVSSSSPPTSPGCCNRSPLCITNCNLNSTIITIVLSSVSCSILHPTRRFPHHPIHPSTYNSLRCDIRIRRRFYCPHHHYNYHHHY